MKNTTKVRHLGVLVLVFALVAVACGDDDAATTTAGAAAEAVFTPGALGAVDIAPGGAVEIRALQAISGDLAFLGDDQVRGISPQIQQTHRDFTDLDGLIHHSG